MTLHDALMEMTSVIVVVVAFYAALAVAQILWNELRLAVFRMKGKMILREAVAKHGVDGFAELLEANGWQATRQCGKTTLRNGSMTLTITVTEDEVAP